MIINPIAAAAAVAARAFAPFSPQQFGRAEAPVRDGFPGGQHFSDVGEDVQAQVAEPEYFTRMAPQTMTPPIEYKDAEILSKDQDTEHKTSTKPPPTLPNTNDPFVLLGVDAQADFDAIQRSYKEMTKLYQPGTVEFARINAAFDVLKRRENEKTVDYSMFSDSEQVTKSVSLSEDAWRQDHYHIDYDRINEMNPEENTWHDEGRDHQNRNRDWKFGMSDHDWYSREEWQRDMFEHDRNMGRFAARPEFEPIPSRERLWEEQRQTFHREQNARHSGFGTDGVRHQRRESCYAHDFQVRHGGNGFPSRRSQSMEARMDQGYPYKDTHWAETHEFVDFGQQYPTSERPVGPDHNPHEDFPQREKWWRVEP